jgi:hypothetical protein
MANKEELAWTRRASGAIGISRVDWRRGMGIGVAIGLRESREGDGMGVINADDGRNPSSTEDVDTKGNKLEERGESMTDSRDRP